jgi:hypothetical protein
LFAPLLPLPRDQDGRAIANSPYPHTQIGRKTSRRRDETYIQAREFGNNGKVIKDIDFTNHGRFDHTNPHQHRYNQITGKRQSAEPFP